MPTPDAIKTPVCDLFGIEHPIFGFAHSVAVVAAVSNAGGLGVYGGTRSTPAEISASLEAVRRMTR